MARRANAAAEISLFPFLSILVCLIGALVLLIVVLSLAQTATVSDLSPQEMERATEGARLRRETAEVLAQREKLQQEYEQKLAAQGNAEEKQDRVIQLRKEFAELERTSDPQKANEAQQKRLENVMRQIQDMAAQKPPLEKEIEALRAELAKRQIKPDANPPPVIVQPGGSGLGSGVTLFFVEANGAGVTVHREKGEPLRIPSAAIGTDDSLNQFFSEAKKARNSLVLFLLRQDGNNSYNLAAGWAEQQYNLRTGKLPIPGGGPIDLSALGFKKR